MAGGSLIGKIHKAFTELHATGLVNDPVTTKMWGAQAAGCNPITDCRKPLMMCSDGAKEYMT